MTKRQLRAAVRKSRAGRQRAKLSADLKAAVGAYCAEQRAAGARWAALAMELGLGENQLRVWSGAGQSRGSKLHRVEVIASPSAGFCLELPGSARVTGLSVADVAALLRELR